MIVGFAAEMASVIPRKVVTIVRKTVVVEMAFAQTRSRSTVVARRIARDNVSVTNIRM